MPVRPRPRGLAELRVHGSANNLPFYPPTAGIPVVMGPRPGRQLATIQMRRYDHRLSIDLHEGMTPEAAAKMAAAFCLAASGKLRLPAEPAQVST